MARTRAARPTGRLTGLLAGGLGLTLAGCGGGSSAPLPTTATVTASARTVTVTSSPAAPSWADLFADVRDGVARISVVSCEGRSVGSGFLVSANEVMTAAHVVRGATSVSVRLGADVYGAVVVDSDDQKDLAMVRLDGDPRGHVFEMGPTAEVGVDVAALGFPLGQPLAMTRGAVTAVDRRVEVNGSRRADLLQTDVAINPGNSGGPVVTIDGQVVGVVSAGSDRPGDGYAVQQPVVSDSAKAWAGAPEQPSGDACPPAASGAAGTPVEVAVTSDAPEAVEIAQVFQLYAQSINDGYYEQAWGLLTANARNRQKNGYDGFASSLRSSRWRELDVVDVQPVDDVTNTAVVEFSTEQDASQGPSGQTCSQWRLTYTLVLDEGDWQIDKAASSGRPTAC